MVVRWTLHDPVLSETWEMQVNPNDGGTPDNGKTVNYSNTAAPDGKTLVYEGRDAVQTLDWTGIILTQEHYDTYIYWFAKRRQLLLTDDLGRETWIYLTKLTPKRKRATGIPWKHDYTVNAIVLDVT